MRNHLSERFNASSDAVPRTAIGRRSPFRALTLAFTALVLCVAFAGITTSTAETPPSPESDKAASTAAELLGAVVSIHVHAVSNARSASSTGRERHGTGVVVEPAAGLVLTSAPLVQEADSITVTTFDARTVAAVVAAQDLALGIAVLRPAAPLGVRALPLGQSRELELSASVTVASAASSRAVAVVTVVDRRDFATEREFLVEDAIFTMPVVKECAGAPLVDGTGKLIGIGALQVDEPTRDAPAARGPGNVFIPVEHFLPVLAQLARVDGRRAPGRPWLGLITQQSTDGLIVTEVPQESPVERAGLRVGDAIRAIGGSEVRTHAELYRSIWRAGAPGTVIRLTIQRGDARREIRVRTIEAQDYLVHRA